MRLRSWSATALGLDCQHMNVDDGAANTEVAELGLEDETEALAFAEQVWGSRLSCTLQADVICPEIPSQTTCAVHSSTQVCNYRRQGNCGAQVRGIV